MRKTIIAVAAALGAAVAVGVTALAVVTPTPTTVPGYELVSDTSDQKWVGGAARDAEKGKWRAYIRRGDEMILLGYFEEEKDARAAGKKAARDKNQQGNNVVDGPGCQTPTVLC